MSHPEFWGSGKSVFLVKNYKKTFGGLANSSGSKNKLKIKLN